MAQGGDRFKVGDTAILSLDAESGWQHMDGERVLVVRGRQWGEWPCEAPDLPRAREIQPGYRYRIRCSAGYWEVGECHLRPIYDGALPSTWAEFVQSTGIDPRARSEAIGG